MVADNSLAGGDSGGPVWIPNQRNPGTSATLAGLTVARKNNGYLIFSPFQRIATDLGLTEWDVRHADSYPGTPAISGSVVSSHPQLTWSATPRAVNYYVYRSWIDYTTLAQSNGFELVGSASSPSIDWTFSVTTATGSTPPGFSSGGYVAYQVVAVDSYGATSPPGAIQYFRLY